MTANPLRPPGSPPRRGGPYALLSILDRIRLTHRKADYWIREGLLGDVPAPGSGGTRILTPGQARSLRFLAYVTDRHSIIGDLRAAAFPATVAASLAPGEVLLVDLASLGTNDPFAVARDRGTLGSVWDLDPEVPRSAAWLVWDPDEEPT